MRAAEIRSPGTFNAKVLRIVDELDGSTAAALKVLNRKLIRNVSSLVLHEFLTFVQMIALEDAESIVSPGKQRIDARPLQEEKTFLLTS